MGIFVFSVSFFLFFLFAPLALIIVIFLLFWFKMETVYCTRFASRWALEKTKEANLFLRSLLLFLFSGDRWFVPRSFHRWRRRDSCAVLPISFVPCHPLSLSFSRRLAGWQLANGQIRRFFREERGEEREPIIYPASPREIVEAKLSSIALLSS